MDDAPPARHPDARLRVAAAARRTSQATARTSASSASSRTCSRSPTSTRTSRSSSCSYSLGEPKYSVEECIERDMTYSAPLKATLQLVINEDVGRRASGRRTSSRRKSISASCRCSPTLGTFVINGAERVIVSQLHRSPGVVFEEYDAPERPAADLARASSRSAARGSSSPSTSTT